MTPNKNMWRWAVESLGGKRSENSKKEVIWPREIFQHVAQGVYLLQIWLPTTLTPSTLPPATCKDCMDGLSGWPLSHLPEGASAGCRWIKSYMQWRQSLNGVLSSGSTLSGICLMRLIILKVNSGPTLNNMPPAAQTEKSSLRHPRVIKPPLCL